MAREGLPIIIFSWILIAVSWIFSLYFSLFFLIVLSVFLTVMGLFVLYFFRNPARQIPDGDRVIVSPADGKIVEICEEMEPHYLKEKSVRVSIFLSIFDVHVNRFPMAGTVRMMFYKPGKFLPAYRSKASEKNEHTCIGIECKNGVKMTVKQIAGIAARRIVCHAKPGKSFGTGERFGLIRFGSRTDLFLPVGTPLSIKVGDKVHGGSTIIGDVVL